MSYERLFEKAKLPPDTATVPTLVQKQVTVAGFVWLAIPPANGSGLLMIGNALRAEAQTAPNLRTKSITISPNLYSAINPQCLVEGAHVVVIAHYTERNGMLPIFEAISVAEYDGQETSEFKDWY
jgi:hypothetical protein